ncbi:MAG: potassium channel family protein [Sporichthyaceae bacterium]
MHIVIMGCGRVGSTLALALEAKGHDVAVVDQEADAFRRLGASFSGRRVTGVGFDQETLLEAGIEQADGFAAVSSGDNSNIISARLAREQFGVDNVVARIYDPARAEVYERLGIPTVATVSWTADQVLRRLLPAGSEPLWRDPSGSVALCQVHLNPAWTGHPATELEAAAGVRIAFLTRLGEGMLPHAETVIQDGDLVHVLLSERFAEAAEAVFAAGPVHVGSGAH